MPTASFRDYSASGAENYQRYFVPAIATPVAAGLLGAADLQPGERILDVACGTGVIARMAAEAVGPTGSVTAIDIAPDMIRVARAVPAPAAPPVDWQQGDATSLPFPDHAYDAVLCQMGLMFMDRPAAVAEMRRVLRPGGRVVISTPGAIQPAFEAMEQAIVEHISADLGGFVSAVFSLHDPDAVAGLLRGAGLVDVTATVSAVTLELPAPADFLWQYISLTPLGPFVAQAPEDARAAMEKQFVERAEPYVVDGALAGTQPMVVATGRKQPAGPR